MPEEPRQWVADHEGTILLITLFPEGELQVAPRSHSVSRWGAPLEVREVAS